MGGVDEDGQSVNDGGATRLPGSESGDSKLKAGTRQRFEGSFAHRLFKRLDALDFTNQAILYGSGLLVSLLPFLILLSAFANERVDDDIALHLGLDQRAANIVSHLFNQASPALNAAAVTGAAFVIAGRSQS